MSSSSDNPNDESQINLVAEEWSEQKGETCSLSLNPLIATAIGKRSYWQLENNPLLTSWISPEQLDMEYYDHLLRQKRSNPSSSSSGYRLGGYQQHRRTLANIVSTIPIIIEDFPVYALLREKLLQQCLDLLAVETEKLGGNRWDGTTKTAKAIRQQGMRKGLQGLFGRIVWYELLEEVHEKGDVGGLERDSIFPLRFKGDPAVVKEFIEGGRSIAQTEEIMRTVGRFMEESCRHLLYERNRTDMKMSNYLNSVRLEEERVNRDLVMKRLICEGGKVEISNDHFLKLLRLYKLHTDSSVTPNDPVFLRRVFCVIQRYETLSGPSDGYQMAFPNEGFKFLRDRFGVTVECFASPLNCWNQRICSVARDTDRFFGSLGNFFRFEGKTGRVTEEDPGLELGGSFEANPPFVEAIMNEMAERIEYLLTRYSHAPFSVIVVVPAWADCKGVIEMTASRFNRPRPGYRLVLKENQHDYRPGMQHRTQHEQQAAHIDTFMFFLQNDKGAERWPYKESDGEELKQLLAATSTYKPTPGGRK